MATKNIKLAGESVSYWQHAAKQFIWPINLDNRTIIVPEKDLEIARSDLMVMHFLNRGWKIVETGEPVKETKVYSAPVTNGKPMFAPKKAEAQEQASEQQFRLGQKFQIKSTGCELEITYIDTRKPVKIHLAYTNRNKYELLASMEQLNKSLKMETWIAL